MTANSPKTRRDKGKKFEIEIAKDLRESGLDKEARRMPCSGALEDLKADLITSLPIHFECKRVEKLNLYDAYLQAESGRKQQEMAIVVHKKSHKPKMAYLKWSDLIQIMVLAKESGGLLPQYGFQKRKQVNK